MRIVAFYDGLAAIAGSPVVRLNRAVAVGMAFGPAAGLELLDGLASEPALSGNSRERELLQARAEGRR